MLRSRYCFLRHTFSSVLGKIANIFHQSLLMFWEVISSAGLASFLHMFCMKSSASLAETFSGNEIQRAVLKAVIKNVRSQFATGVYLLACAPSAHAGAGGSGLRRNGWYKGLPRTRRGRCQAASLTTQLWTVLSLKHWQLRHGKANHKMPWFNILCAPSKLAVTPTSVIQASWCWRRLLTRLFRGTVGGTTCTYQLAICHSDWSLCNNDTVVINLVIFLVGELAWALPYKPKRKPAAHLGRMPWKLCFVLHDVLLECIV